MSDVLEELVAAGKRRKQSDAAFALSHYIEHPARLHCLVAIDDDARILGFQSLKIADEGNPCGTALGWGIIGTHVRPSAARRGVGRELFAAIAEGARKARLPAIEAYIGNDNSAALDYYEAMGFRTYRESEGVSCKVLWLTAEADV